MIDPYMDAELREKEEAALSEHLKSCAVCSGEALGRLRLKQANQIVGRRYTPGPDLRARIQREVLGTKRRPLVARLLPAFAAAATMIVIAYLGTLLSLRKLERQHVLAQVTDNHVTDLASASPVDVVSSDRHTVKPWFAGKIPFTFNLPELANTPFTLLGGRVAYADGMPGAQLLFQIRQHRISVFIFEDRVGLGRTLGFGDTLKQQRSFNIETWSEGGLRYFVISDVSPDDIRQLSQLLKSAAKS